MSELSQTPSADFAAEVLAMDWHETVLTIKGRRGAIMYVRPERGVLPSLVRSVLVGEHYWVYGSLYGRPARGEFSPELATLVFPVGREYPVTLLATLPMLDTMRPYLRGGLTPPPDIGPAAWPVAIEGIPRGFRATGARLISKQVDEIETDDDLLEALRREAQQHPDVRKAAINILSALGKDAPLDQIIDALYDEDEDVRKSASYTLSPLAAELPLQPFLDTLRDTSRFNEAAYRVAIRVFAAHADTISVEVVLDLFTHAPEPTIAALAVQVMGHLGARSPEDILASILLGTSSGRMSADIRVKQQAALALGQLGEHASLGALIAGMNHFNVAPYAARAILDYPGQIPDDVHARAEEIVAKDRETQRMYGHVINRPRPDPEVVLRNMFSQVLDVAGDRTRTIPTELLQRMCGDLYSALTAEAAEVLSQRDSDAMRVVALEAEALLAGQAPGPFLSSMVNSLFVQMIAERHIDSPAALAALAELLYWPYWQVRSGAIWALTQFERPLPATVRKRIEELMLDPESAAVRIMAMNAVAKLGSQHKENADE